MLEQYNSYKTFLDGLASKEERKEMERVQKIKAEKQVSRKQRIKSQIPVVALVGYTNAGKSSLMNSLSSYLHNTSDPVFEKDDTTSKGSKNSQQRKTMK